VEAQKRSRQWVESDGKYIPHPATWLNQGRWDDEVDPRPPKFDSRRISEAWARVPPEEMGRDVEL